MDQPPRNALLDKWLRLVHSTGCEVGVTLLVSGRVVSGLLTPVQRFTRWENEVTMRAVHGGGQFRLPSPGLGPPTKEECQAIVDEWEALERNEADEPDAKGWAFCCLRNAEVFDAIEGSQVKFPMLMVAMSKVAAYSIGNISMTSATEEP